MTEKELEAYLHHKIPLARAMGAAVVEALHGGGITLRAPLTLNHNHLGTAFGGSLNALATLAAYAMLWFELGEPEAHLVIAESSMAFLRPVREDLTAICASPKPETLARFREEFARKGKARIRVEAVLEEEGMRAARFRGTFVAIR